MDLGNACQVCTHLGRRFAEWSRQVIELAKKAETGYLSDVLIVFSLWAETISNFSPKCSAMCPWKRGCPKITRCGLSEGLWTKF